MSMGARENNKKSGNNSKPPGREQWGTSRSLGACASAKKGPERDRMSKRGREEGRGLTWSAQQTCVDVGVAPARRDE